MDVVTYRSHTVEPFFYSKGGQFIVIIEQYAAWIKATDTSVGGEFVGSSGCGIIGKFCKR